MKISRLFNSLPKRIVASAIVALAFALPAATFAADMVTIEGSMGVVNVTTGGTKYAESTTASYNQVVKLQVYYHNRENPDSGKIANNLNVKINIPSTPGTTQTQTATIKADNSNTVTDTTTVKLDRSDAYLQYIPGTAVWRHNVGTNEDVKVVDTTVSDDIVTSGTGLVLENEKPCYNFSATVTVMARVMIPGTKVVKQVEKASETDKWATTNSANPGETLKYMISYQNTGNTTAKDVIVRDNLPPYLTYVPGTTKIVNGSHPASNPAIDDTNKLTTDGIVIGDYAPGAVAYVTFEAKIADEAKMPCGVTRLTNVGVAHPTGTPEYFNTAYTNVNRECKNQPKYSCDLLTVTKGDNRKITASVAYTGTNGATLKTVTYNFGDGSTPLTTDKTNVTYTYAKDGTYAVTATLTFSVNGADKTGVTSAACAQSVTFTTPTPPVTPPVTPPTVLPSTGAGSVVGIAAAAMAVGTIGYRLFVSRKLARR